MGDEDLRELERVAGSGDEVVARKLMNARQRAGLCVFHGPPRSTCSACASVRAIDWAAVFNDVRGQWAEGASSEQLRQLEEDVRRPLSEPEREVRAAEAKRIESGVEPAAWVLPDLPLPPAYLSFLA